VEVRLTSCPPRADPHQAVEPPTCCLLPSPLSPSPRWGFHERTIDVRGVTGWGEAGRGRRGWEAGTTRDLRAALALLRLGNFAGTEVKARVTAWGEACPGIWEKKV